MHILIFIFTLGGLLGACCFKKVVKKEDLFEQISRENLYKELQYSKRLTRQEWEAIRREMKRRALER